jgi:hypothetical protein
MRTAVRAILAAALTLSIAGPARAHDADRQSLYSSINLLTFFDKEHSAALKITPTQERALKATEDRRQKLWQKFVEQMGKIRSSKMPKAEADAKERALDTKLVDDLVKVYGETLSASQVKRMKQIVLQIRGMEVFDYPEVREALKIGDKEVRKLRDAYDKMAREMVEVLKANVAAKRMTSEEAARIAWSMRVSVPEKVRESLNEDQKKVLEDLLGEKFTYKK